MVPPSNGVPGQLSLPLLKSNVIIVLKGTGGVQCRYGTIMFLSTHDGGSARGTPQIVCCNSIQTGNGVTGGTVIQKGQVYDGSGAPALDADVRVRELF